MDTRYDDDGYYTSVPVLILTTRENVQLPAGTTEAEIGEGQKKKEDGAGAHPPLTSQLNRRITPG